MEDDEIITIDPAEEAGEGASDAEPGQQTKKLRGSGGAASGTTASGAVPKQRGRKKKLPQMERIEQSNQKSEVATEDEDETELEEDKLLKDDEDLTRDEEDEEEENESDGEDGRQIITAMPEEKELAGEDADDEVRSPKDDEDEDEDEDDDDRLNARR